MPLKVVNIENHVTIPFICMTSPDTIPSCLDNVKILKNNNYKKITHYHGPNTKQQPQNRFKLRSLTFVAPCKEPFV
jgi:hypothetical protein